MNEDCSYHVYHVAKEDLYTNVWSGAGWYAELVWSRTQEVMGRLGPYKTAQEALTRAAVHVDGPDWPKP